MMHYTCDKCGKVISPRERIAVSIRSIKPVTGGKGGAAIHGQMKTNSDFLYIDLCKECHAFIMAPLRNIATSTSEEDDPTDILRNGNSRI